MQFSAVVLAAFAAVAVASPIEQAEQADKPTLYLSGPGNGGQMAPPPSSDSGSSGNKCVDCAKYCKDPSNGAAIGAACLVVKCGIQCLIG